MEGKLPIPKDYSPFTPGQPVPAEFFVGRLPELERLRKRVERAASRGTVEVAFLSGERGIGKSSLASFLRVMAERDLRAIAVHAFLGGVASVEELVKRVFDRLLKESVRRGWYDRVKEMFGKHVQEVGLFGISVEFQAKESELARLARDFAPALRNLMGKVGSDHKCMLVILDDINGIAESDEFANWLKSLNDELATAQDRLPLVLALVGLDERRLALVHRQPSLARVFDLVEIQPWTPSESKDFFRNAFAKVGVTVDEDALASLARTSGGLPVLAHEIGDAVFRWDEDRRIDHLDAMRGIFDAADIVGRKHLEPSVLDAIRSERYRTILRKAVKVPFEMDFRRSELLARLDGKERGVLDNFLTRMKRLGVIRPEPSRGAGAYRFANLLHCLYFHMEAQRAAGSRS